eukprot:747227-Hanusia_phi.AAC.2
MLQYYNELATFCGSFLMNQILYWILPAKGEDVPRLKSCYLSHIHCAVTITSCLTYWATNKVDVFSPQFMVEGPDGSLASWMRCTVAFSVGYFVNDFVLILAYPSVGGADMIAHHIIIGDSQWLTGEQMLYTLPLSFHDRGTVDAFPQFAMADWSGRQGCGCYPNTSSANRVISDNFISVLSLPRAR